MPVSNDSALQSYRQILQKQATARTPLLDDVLSVVEERASALRQDFDIIQREHDDTLWAHFFFKPSVYSLTSPSSTRTLNQKLINEYKPDAGTLCLSICDTLQAALDSLSENIGR